LKAWTRMGARAGPINLQFGKSALGYQDVICRFQRW
jgi:hypothetical protein